LQPPAHWRHGLLVRVDQTIDGQITTPSDDIVHRDFAIRIHTPFLDELRALLAHCAALAVTVCDGFRTNNDGRNEQKRCEFEFTLTHPFIRFHSLHADVLALRRYLFLTGCNSSCLLAPPPITA
jgi:hypothetical protein